MSCMPALDSLDVPVVIYGNGAIARLLYSYARRSMKIAGFTVDDACMASGVESFAGLPLLPFSRVEQHFDPRLHRMLIAIGFLDMNALRVQKYAEAQAKGYQFASYVHESVLQHDEVTIGDNCIILDHVSIHPGCKVGAGVFIASNVNLGHDCVLGDFNWINSGVAIAGGTRIGAECFLGVNASIGNGLAIGARNFVASNTLINKSTLDDQVYLSEAGQLFQLKSKAFLRFSGILGGG